MLVGRESELTRAAAMLEDGRPFAVLGEPGVGKTTLVREAGAAAGRELREGGALATLQWLPYLPIRRAVGDDVVQGDHALVASRVERRIGPAVLFLDDLHWADGDSQALLPFLVGRTALVVALRRGEPSTASALELLDSLGFELIALEPLEETDASRLARGLRPELDATSIENVVRQSGGNPLLIEELAATGEPTRSLQLSLAARLRRLSDEARRSMGLLSLAGRPLPAAVLAPGVDELEQAGLVRIAGDRATVRHAVIGDAAADALADTDRQALHAQLAELLNDPGEIARHLNAAGERAAAFERAQEAVGLAKTPGERAAHLGLAASCATGPDADRLRVEAAGALSDAHMHEAAQELISSIESDDPVIQAEVELVRARARWAASDAEGAEGACAAGLALVGGSGQDVEARLLLMVAEMAVDRALACEIELEPAREAAEAARRAARAASAYEARSRRLVATTRLAALEDRWDEEFERAIRAADREGDPAAELAIARRFAYGLVLAGQLERCRKLCDRMIVVARSAGMLSWERRLRHARIAVAWHGGRPREALDEALALNAELTPGDGVELGFYVAQAQTDLGRHEEALAHAEREVQEASASASWFTLGESLWAKAEALFWAGRTQEALAAAEEGLAIFGDRGPTVYLQLTRAWAQLELGTELSRPKLDALQPIVEGGAYELDALASLSKGDNGNAATLFARAAALWAGRHTRGELRCLWGAGEATRRGGRPAAAIEQLEALEARCEEVGYAAVLARAQRSLRLAGARRSAARAQAGSELTAREEEILALAATGLSNAQIARRLGIGRSTVERLVASASRKLGARSRLQAAAMAARR